MTGSFFDLVIIAKKLSEARYENSGKTRSILIDLYNQSGLLTSKFMVFAGSFLGLPAIQHITHPQDLVRAAVLERIVNFVSCMLFVIISLTLLRLAFLL